MEDEATRFPSLAGSDAERRTALALAERLRAGGGREVMVETEWVRPRGQLAYALHAALGVAASVVAVAAPAVGLGLAALALLSLLLDLSGRLFLLRRLTPERATQNVIAPARFGGDPRLRVLLVAGCDVERSGIAARVGGRARRGRGARLSRARGAAPGAMVWVVVSLVLVLGCSVVRVASGDVGTVIGGVQLVPTLVLLVALALFLDAATAKPAAFDMVAVDTLIEAATTLDAAPARHVAVDVVIAGAESGRGVGFLKLLRRHRFPRVRTAVIELRRAPAAGWQTSDGPLFPLRYHPQLLTLAAKAAAEERELGATPTLGHASGAAFRARQRRLPAIRLGAPDEPALLSLVLALVEALDADLARDAR